MGPHGPAHIPCRIVSKGGVFFIGEAGIGAEGIETIRLDYILRQELVGGPEGDTVHVVVAEDVLALEQEPRARRLAIREMGLESDVLVSGGEMAWAS